MLVILLSMAGVFWLSKLDLPNTGRTQGLPTIHATPAPDSPATHNDALADITLLLDFSGSMKAMDFKIKEERASRIDALKLATKGFIEGHPKNRIGIVTFAGAPYVLDAPTFDHASLLAKLDMAKPGSVGPDGTAVGSAIAAGCVQLETSGDRRRLLVVITDGNSNDGFITPTTAAEYAAQQKLGLFVVGLGSSGFAPVPVVDSAGNTVYRNIKMTVDYEGLRRIAEVAQGQFRTAATFEALVEVFKEVDALSVEKSAGSPTAALPNRFYRCFGKVALQDNALQLEEPAKEEIPDSAISAQRLVLAKQPPPSMPPAAERTTPGFADLTLAHSSPRVGEPAVVRIRMYVPSEIRWEPLAIEFLPEGFIKERQREPTNTTVEIEGRSYDLFQFETTLTPLRPGPITIQPVTIKYKAHLPRPRTVDSGSTGQTKTFHNGVFKTVPPPSSAAFTSVQNLSVSTAAVVVEVKP